MVRPTFQSPQVTNFHENFEVTVELDSVAQRLGSYWSEPLDEELVEFDDFAPQTRRRRSPEILAHSVTCSKSVVRLPGHLPVSERALWGH